VTEKNRSQWDATRFVQTLTFFEAFLFLTGYSKGLQVLSIRKKKARVEEKEWEWYW
jgi:hypothetical protein